MDLQYLPFVSIFPEKHRPNLSSVIILNILKDYVKVLDTKDRKLITEWKGNFFMRYHRNKFRDTKFKDGEVAFYIFEYLFKNSALVYRNWFKENHTINVEGFSVRPDFKNYTCKKSFINYFSNYEIDDLKDDIRIKL